MFEHDLVDLIEKQLKKLIHKHEDKQKFDKEVVEETITYQFQNKGVRTV